MNRREIESVCFFNRGVVSVEGSVFLRCLTVLWKPCEVSDCKTLCGVWLYYENPLMCLLWKPSRCLTITKTLWGVWLYHENPVSVRCLNILWKPCEVSDCIVLYCENHVRCVTVLWKSYEVYDCIMNTLWGFWLYYENPVRFQTIKKTLFMEEVSHRKYCYESLYMEEVSHMKCFFYWHSKAPSKKRRGINWWSCLDFGT